MGDQQPVLVTGASGFVGSAVLRQRDPSLPVRSIARSLQGPTDRNVDNLKLDLRSSAAIGIAVDGVTSVIHCASYVGPDPDLAWQINYAVSRDVVRAAASSGAAPLLYVSTTGVYGWGRKAGQDETAPIAPDSETSRSRRAAEEVFLSAGGTVIRPHLLYGVGDQHVLPLLHRAARTIGLPNGGRTVVSILNVDELAQQIWTLWGNADCTGAYNAVSGDPVSLIRILNEVERHVPEPCALPGEPALSAHQLDMMSEDNWFRSRLPASLLTHLPTFRLTDAMVNWYRGRADFVCKPG